MTARHLCVAFLVAVGLGAPHLVQADPVLTPFPSVFFDGPARHAARHGDTLYVAGDFTRVYFGANSLPSVYAVSETTGLAAASFPIANGRVALLEPDGAGGHYVGGAFTTIGGVAQPHLAHVLANGAVDAAFRPTALTGPPVALTLLGPTLFVAGPVAATPTGDARIAALSASDGSRQAWQPMLPSSVTISTLRAAVDRVTIGGVDTALPRQPGVVGAYDATSGAQMWQSVLTLPASPPQATGAVYTLAVAGADVLVGHASDVAYKGLSRMSLATGATSAFASPGGETRHIAVSGSVAVVSSGSGISAVDLSTNALLAHNVSYGTVSTLAVSALGTVFVSGSYRIAELAATTLTPTAWSSEVAPSDVYTLSAAGPGGTLLVSSSRAATDPVPRNYLAAFSLSTGALLPFTATLTRAPGFLGASPGRVEIVDWFDYLQIDDVTGHELSRVSLTGFLFPPSGVFADEDVVYLLDSHPMLMSLKGINRRTGAGVPFGLGFGVQGPFTDPVFGAATRDADTVYAAANWGAALGEIVAVDATTNDNRWRVFPGGTRSLAVSGDTLYVVDGAGQLRTVDAQTGGEVSRLPATPELASVRVLDGRLLVRERDPVTGWRFALRTLGGQPVPWSLDADGIDLGAHGDVWVAFLEDTAAQPHYGLAVFSLDGSRPPTNLRRRYHGTDTMFEWDAPATAPSGYVLEAGVAPGQTAAAIGVPSPRFSVAVPPGVFFVRVRTPAGDVSNEIMVQGGACTVPPPVPASFTATLSGTATTLSWSPPAGPVASYVLSAGTTLGASDIASVTVTGTTTSVSGTLSPGRYFIRVRAANACGTSGASSEVLLVPGSGAALPDAPTGLTALTTASGDVRLEWQAPAGPITGYLIEAGTARGARDLVAAVLSPATSLTVPGPRGLRTIYVRVRAISAAGTGPASTDLRMLY